MKLRAIIVDDEQKGIDALKILIETFIPDVRVVAESVNGGKSIEMIENYKPEIVFLDINMPELNGFELLEKLKWKDFNLIFTTAHQEHALRALKNNAIDYLLKPIDHEDLEAAIDRVFKKMHSSQDNKFNYYELLKTLGQAQKRVIINSRTGVESLDMNEIIWLESKSNYTEIHLTSSREIVSSKPLKEFDQQLCVDNSNFMRIHNSFIVNLTRVSRYLKTSECVIMSDESKIPVAKSRREIFYKWMEV